MNNKLKLLVVMCLVFALALGTTACKKKPAETSSNPSSVEQQVDDNSSEETIDDSSEESTDDYIDQSYEELPFEDEPIVDEPIEDEPIDDIYYSKLTVQNGSTPVNDNFLGINGVHMGWGFMPDVVKGRNPLTHEQREEEYDRIAYTMGVKQIRTFYTSAFAWDESKNKWDWDVKSNNVLSGFYDSLKAWQDRDVIVGMSPQWSLQSFVKDISSNNPISSFGGVGFYVEDDLDTTLKNYRTFMKETFLSLKANGINNVKYLFAYTECNNTFREENAELYPDKTTFEHRDYDKVSEIYGKAITELDGALKDAGVRSNYKIVGPCDNFRSDFEYTDPEQYSTLTKYTLENLADKVDIIGSHGGYSGANEFIEDSYFYNPSTTMKKTREMAVSAGKDFWIDEYNATIYGTNAPVIVEERRASDKTPFKGVALAATINGVLNMGASNMFIWALADMQWPNNTNNVEFDKGMQIQGYLQSPIESSMPHNSWYAVSLLTRYIGQGTVYSCVDDFGIYISCIERNDGEWTVVVTNYNITDAPIHLNFEKAFEGKTFYRHMYDVSSVVATPDAEIINVSAVAKNVTTGFYDTVPPYSVTIYTTDKD